MKPPFFKGAAPAPRPEPTLAGTIEMVETLIAVITEENAALAEGFPPVVAGATMAKSTLAAELGRSMRALVLRGLPKTGPELEQRRLLLERARVLEVRTAENMARLEGAIEATRRRVDAVMHALRDHMATGRKYGNDARTARPPQPTRVGRGLTA